jgi:energy-coupling factor transporter ATP-binding protein EcfA2
MIDVSYTFTEEGRRFTLDALQQSRYAGPAPVAIEEFVELVNLQKITNELVTYDRILEAFKGLTVAKSIIEKSGPALNSGRAMLLYGPPGNGKSTIAQCFNNVFKDVIYMPYAVMVEGQVIRVYDPSYHSLPLGEPVKKEEDTGFIRREQYDSRWVPCRRPFIVVGGELTLEMLDLRYDATSNFYEAPLHMKALGGCFIIDDFGRQLVSPTNLLNRWIVPLENRIDYLKLHTGKSFTIPFEEMVIFSTNLEPEQLMDPAFLRRLPYKIEVAGPDRQGYRRIFEKECDRAGMTLSDDLFDLIVYKISVEKGLEFAAYHPKFIVDQVAATCRFMAESPHFEPRYIEYAIDNLRVHRPSDANANELCAAR